MKKTMLKWKTEEKTRENDKPRVVLEKGLGGGGGGENKQNISRIAGNPLSVSAIIAPLLKKKPRIAGKTAFVVLISKQNNRHKEKKGRSTKNNDPHKKNQASPELVHQTHQKEKLSRKVQVKEKMGTTTVRSTPNQNQQEKNKKEESTMPSKK